MAKAIFGEKFLKGTKMVNRECLWLNLSKLGENQFQMRLFDVESASEEFWESGAEASFVVANSLDSFLAWHGKGVAAARFLAQLC